MTWKQRYAEAHYNNLMGYAPAVIRDGLYSLPKYPDVRKSGGLTTFIKNFINWNGGNADRNNTQGRLIEKKVKTISGASFTDRIMIKAASRRGGADVKGTILGRSVNLEVKISPDKPSEFQLKEQIRERRAGGVYEFIYSAEEFLQWYDKFVSSIQAAG